MSKPWAYVAHKDGYWAGLVSASMPRKDLIRCIGEWVADGLTITTAHSRDEFLALLATLRPWDERPAPLPLFEQAATP